MRSADLRRRAAVARERVAASQRERARVADSTMGFASSMFSTSVVSEGVQT
jgi:hypothetical protein